MWLLNIVFTVLVIVACIPAVLWGGWEGRRICLIFVIAGLVTMKAITFLRTTLGLPAAIHVVDILVALALLQIALRTDRYWPLWIFAFHLLSLLTYLAWLIAPVARSQVFDAVASFWSIPELVILAIGPVLDRRYERTAKRGREQDASTATGHGHTGRAA